MAGYEESLDVIGLSSVADATQFLNYFVVLISRKVKAGMLLCTHKAGGKCQKKQLSAKLWISIGSPYMGYNLYIRE
jgi:hypothetical protein